MPQTAFAGHFVLVTIVVIALLPHALNCAVLPFSASVQIDENQLQIVMLRHTVGSHHLLFCTWPERTPSLPPPCPLPLVLWRLRHVKRDILSTARQQKKTSFSLPCLAIGLFEEVDHEGHLDCIDIDYCTRNPCGSHAECFDCSTQDCSDAVTEKSFLQRRGIIGGTESEATDDYACWCNEHFLTTVGSNGELTCCKDHSCGVGGSCVDLSIVSDVSSQSFTCACSWGYELNQNGGADGRDTCSPISCGGVSVEYSDALFSAELFAGDHDKRFGRCQDPSCL